jgi:hypothetical protein
MSWKEANDICSRGCFIMATKFRDPWLTFDGTILRNKSDIASYEAEIQWLIKRIEMSNSGRALLQLLKGTGKSLTIQPITTGNCTDVQTKHLSPLDATQRGEPFIKSNGKPAVFTKGILFTHKYEAIGTGRGSDVVISFSPGPFMTGGSCTPYGTAGNSPSAALFHELVHAFRMMSGRQLSSPALGGRANYHDEEDFLAIVLTNIFVTDPTNPTPNRTLRADHISFNPLAPDLSTSTGFIADAGNKRMLTRLCISQPPIIYAFSTVPATFNPIHALYGPMKP